MTNPTFAIVTPPDIEPFMAELMAFYKAQHIRYNEGDAEDGVIEQYLKTAIELFELHTNGRIVLETEYAEFLPLFGSKPIELTLAKVLEITEIGYFGEDDIYHIIYSGAEKTVEFGDDLSGIPAIIWLKEGATWPTVNAYRPRPVVIKYTAGWPDNELPADVKTAIFLLATHFYTFRGDENVDIPDGFLRLARKYHTGNIII